MERAAARMTGPGRVGQRIFAVAAIVAALPARAAHTGIVAPRTGFAWSDVAAFVAFAVMVVLARRAIRKRKRKD